MENTNISILQSCKNFEIKCRELLEGKADLANTDLLLWGYVAKFQFQMIHLLSQNLM